MAPNQFQMGLSSPGGSAISAPAHVIKLQYIISFSRARTENWQEDLCPFWFSSICMLLEMKKVISLCRLHQAPSTQCPRCLLVTQASPAQSPWGGSDSGSSAPDAACDVCTGCGCSQQTAEEAPHPRGLQDGPASACWLAWWESHWGRQVSVYGWAWVHRAREEGDQNTEHCRGLRSREECHGRR